MKILDRYVLLSFLRDYIISFVVLIGMYIVLDMVFNFDELVETKGIQPSTLEVVGNIISYYYYQSFLIFAHLSGIIPVVAAAFTLIRMSRFNELTAILAAGVPLLRVAAPIILAAVVLQGLLAVDQELLIPNMIAQLTRDKDELNQTSSVKSFEVKAMQDDRNNVLFAGRFTPAGKNSEAAGANMREVDIIERDDRLQPTAHILADRAEWEPRSLRWKLVNGVRVTGLQPDQSTTSARTTFYKSNITPDEISLFHSGEYVTLLSRDRINQLLQRPQIYAAIDLLRVKHFRLSQLLMNIVMLLVAIPCVLQREPGRLKTSIFQCLVLVGLCMASFFVAYQFAGLPPAGAQWTNTWPAMLAFAPVLVFGPVAVFLLDRLRT